MAHESLYRTYRPKTFAEVVGQEQVTKPLADAIAAGDIGHAYLFSGSRGLGKTSVARIFAREINKDRFDENDVHEIDAASNNSVEDIRALAEGVYTLPFGSTYKVYILDEVHMLSKAAWNAFLKTLEEPPAHAVFILATTEPDRVPETVQSRCQMFTFKQPARDGLAQLITKVAAQEDCTIDPDAAELVALLADGSYRDALSVLQTVLPRGEGKGKTKLSREEVERLTGAPKRALIEALVMALAESSASGALTAVEQAATSGTDMRLFLDLVLSALRSALLIRYAADLREALKKEQGAETYAVLEKASSMPGVTPNTLRVFLEAAERMRYAPVPALPLELAIFELFPQK